MQFLIFIGIALAITGIALIGILKAPLNTSDKLLIAILVSFIVKFSFDELSLLMDNLYYGAIAGVVGSSTESLWISCINIKFLFKGFIE